MIPSYLIDSVSKRSEEKNIESSSPLFSYESIVSMSKPNEDGPDYKAQVNSRTVIAEDVQEVGEASAVEEVDNHLRQLEAEEDQRQEAKRRRLKDEEGELARMVSNKLEKHQELQNQQRLQREAAEADLLHQHRATAGADPAKGTSPLLAKAQTT